MRWQMVRGPCPPDCPDRKPGSKEGPSCHATCKKYKAFAEERKAAYKKTLDEGQLKDYYLKEVRKNGRDLKYQ